MALNADAMRVRRHARVRPMTDINIAPFVDIMLVLVVILMISAPLLEVGVPVDLPDANVQPVNQDREPLILTVDRDGQIYLQEEPIDADLLVPRLIAMSESNRDVRLFVQGDAALQYGRVMEIMGKVSEAGINSIALIAELPPLVERRP